MRPPPFHHPPIPCRSAFSLVEVVLAIGIVSFALLAIFGLFSHLSTQAAESAKTREAINSLASLRSFLDTEPDFDTVYGWAANQTADKELVHVTYGVDDAGDPATPDQATRTVSKWFDPDQSASALAAANAVREGSCVKAVLSGQSNLQPVTPLPATPTSYNSSYVVLSASLYALPEPSATLDREVPAMVVPIPVSR